MIKKIMGCLVGCIFIFGVFNVKAEDNKTINDPPRTPGGFPKILDDDVWPSQILYDTIGACYTGTIKWVVLTNPSLIGQIPSPMAQRQMVEHCFCVMDKIRKEIEYKELLKKMPKNVNWGALAEYETKDYTSASQEFACTSAGGCELVDITPS